MATATEYALVQYKRAAEGLQQKLKNVQAKAKESSVVQGGVQTVVGVGSALGAGYIDGRYPDKTVLSMPLSLVIGAGATILSMSGYAGKSAHTVQAIGTGALAAYAAQKGLQMGKDAKADDDSGKK